MTLFPSTPRQDARSTAESGSSNPVVRKASSLLDLKKRIVPSPWRGGGGGDHQTQLQGPVAAESSVSISTASTSSAGSNAWTKLVAGHMPHHHHHQQQHTFSSTSMRTPASSSDSSSSLARNAIAIQAYLRIRPPPRQFGSSTSTSAPNVQTLNLHDAVMSSSGDPSSFNMPRSSSISSFSLANPTSAGLPLTPPNSYSFTEIFDNAIEQKTVFQKTTLPLIENLLGINEASCMENALIFAYGASGGGKTYTVQGSPSGDPGLLPRALDTVMNTVSNKHTMSHLRPCRLTGLEITPKNERLPPGKIPQVGFDPSTVRKTVMSGDVMHLMNRDETTLPLSGAYEYSVWASYAEVYNEKVYDLFDTSDKRKALSLKSDRQAGNKYISGLKEVRIWSSEDAQTVLQKGHINRQVFSTRLNGSSSRSHSIFTIKIVRLARNVDPEDPGVMADMSRLSIVDLAGSERYKNTQTKGERLKEAGNINKSLMVLGQCLEVMRKNQEDKLKGRKPAIVPFRHSKLTELFQTFFNGNGKAVMIAAINPYQTSYEENLNVLRFTAIAKQIVIPQSVKPTTANLVQSSLQSNTPHYQQPLKPAIARHLSNAKNLPVMPTLSESDASTIDTSILQENENNEEGSETIPEEESTEMIQGDKDDEDEDTGDSQSYSDIQSEDDEYGEDAFVEHLLDEIRALRRRVVQLEIERDTDVMMAVQAAEDKGEEENQRIERDCARRLKEMNERFDYKMDMKIDILARTHQAFVARIQQDHQVKVEQLQKQLEGKEASHATALLSGCIGEIQEAQRTLQETSALVHECTKPPSSTTSARKSMTFSQVLVPGISPSRRSSGNLILDSGSVNTGKAGGGGKRSALQESKDPGRTGIEQGHLEGENNDPFETSTPIVCENTDKPSKARKSKSKSGRQSDSIAEFTGVRESILTRSTSRRIV